MATHNAFEAAAAVAFWFFLSLVPLLVLIGFVVGHVARTRGIDTLLGPLLDVIPATAEDIVRKELERLAGASGSSIAPLGALGYLWTASSGLHNLMDVFETSARVLRRPWWQQRSIALGWVVLGLAAVCSLAWILVRVDNALNARDAAAVATPSPSASSAARSPAGPQPGRAPERAPSGRTQVAAAKVRSGIHRRVSKALHTPVEQAVATVGMLAVGMAFLAGFYRFAVEHPPRVRRRVWPGTFAAVGGWLAVSWAFGAYVVSIADYALYYGSLAAVAVMLIWLYLTSLMLVVGAEVNAQLEGVRPRR